MCGRISMTTPFDAMVHLFRAVPTNDLPVVPDYNHCPTQMLGAVTADGPEGARRLRPMRWGFVPLWYKTVSDGPLLINARAETIAEKPAFRAAVRTRRCLVPVDGFYEWQAGAGKSRLPWYVTRSDGALMVFAGIWQDWPNANDVHADTAAPRATLAIVTCAANATMARVHDRLPVILEPQDWPLWLGEAGTGAARLMVPAADDVIRMHRVDPAVNSNRASGPGLIVPLAD